MVVFDILCLNGHQFEGWFASLADLENQIASKLMVCPICGGDQVTKLPSTFGMVKSRPNVALSQETTQPNNPNTEQEKITVAFNRLKDFSERLENEFYDVGPNFADEAIKMHYGVSPRRNIRGMSTFTEEKLLKKEGIDFFKVPMLVRKSTAN
ncbi:MAG: DUF1178 family protein [Deltaproteobacteria bacterium]|jgi:hypothetical protein|nr:DUF1178 family protein [Deltaproteobacteria bacterium]